MGVPVGMALFNKNKFARQQAITIYQKVTLQSILTFQFQDTVYTMSPNWAPIAFKG